MAVKPYWWCPDCETTHDSSVAACVNCGRVGLAKKSMQVPAIEASAPAPKPPWTAYVPLHAAAIHRAVEGGSGIAALALKAPSRARPPRHETRAWSGRYGWLS